MWEAAGSQRQCNASGCAEYLADGTVYEWGAVLCPGNNTSMALMNVPFAFPHTMYSIQMQLGAAFAPSQLEPIGAQPASQTQFYLTCETAGWAIWYVAEGY